MSKKPPKLSPEESDTFRDAVKDVKRLPSAQRKHPPTSKPKAASRRQQHAIPAKARDAFDFYTDDYSAVDAVTADEALFYARTGVQNRILAKLKRGQFAPEARLDLHRLTVSAALHQTDLFLAACQHAQRRVICIVHGKGFRSDNQKPKIKNALNAFLQTHPAVLAFCSTHARHGGTGAVYVLLKILSTKELQHHEE